MEKYGVENKCPVCSSNMSEAKTKVAMGNQTVETNEHTCHSCGYKWAGRDRVSGPSPTTGSTGKNSAS